VSNDEHNIELVKTWIICLTVNRGDREACRKYVKNFTVPRGAVLTSLVLASVSSLCLNSTFFYILNVDVNN